MKAMWVRSAVALACGWMVVGGVWAQDVPHGDAAPEIATGFTAKKAVHKKRSMVATANPHATQAGYDVLRAGGNALDAAFASAIMLTLTEPQSSGIGGGAFTLFYNKAANHIAVFDGREKAPAAATGDRFLNFWGRPISLQEAIGSGKSVGVPGLIRMMELAHKKNGKLPWARLFEPTIKLAQNGFPVSRRLAMQIAATPSLANDPTARAYFFDAEGKPLKEGALLRNPELAATLQRVAQEGADAFYKGEIARDIAAKVTSHPVPGDMTEQDIANYSAQERQAICGNYRSYKVCGMPPPSSGGIAILAMLGALERFPMATVKPNSAQAVHLHSEAARLAYADRDFYVGDPDFVQVPTAALVQPDYLRQRSGLIDEAKSMRVAQPGKPQGVHLSWAPDLNSEVPATSHVSVVDKHGNAISLTTTIEAQFGSQMMVRGFLLNNQMTDFSFIPEENGLPVANRIEGNKRPRSSMSPTLVFDDKGKLFMTVGSPGGSAIINYVAKTLLGVLDWKLDVQTAISLPNRGSRNRATEVEKDTPLEKVVPQLRAMGHDVNVIEYTSGLQGIVVTPKGLIGGADPRREGVVMGD